MKGIKILVCTFDNTMIMKTVVKNSMTPIWLAKGADGKITEVKDALGNTTTYVYGTGTGCSSCSGSGDNLISATDANNKTTTYEYYKNGWKKNQKDPLNHVTTYTYDPTGFMTQEAIRVWSTHCTRR